MASTAIGTSPWPVITMTGSSGSTPCESRSSSSPSIPSIFRSVTRMPGKSVVNRFSAVAAWSCTSVSSPARPSHCVTASRIDASSSTKTTGPYSGMDRVLDLERLPHMARKRNGQLSPAVGAVGGLYPAAKVLHDAVGNGKTQPKPLSYRLGGEEWIEHAIDLVGRDAMAVVSDNDRHAVTRCANGQANARVVAFDHCIERVAQEIEHHLLELNRLSHDPDVRGDIPLDTHSGCPDLRLEQKQGALDGALDQDRFGVTGFALARECLQVAGDARHAFGQVSDEIEVARHLNKIAPLHKDPGAGHEGADRRQRLVDLVRDRRRHLPERGEFAGLHQLVLGFAQTHLSPASLLDLGLQRSIGFAQFVGALRHLPLELGAGFASRDIGTVTLHHVERQDDDEGGQAAADDGAVALILVHRR